MTRNEFSSYLGFSSWEDLMDASELLAEEGEVSAWYITRLPDGRWAAWDSAELAPDRVEYFPTREEAMEYQNEGILLKINT